jgi:ubiquinone biosynthesis protein UbiJ
MADTPLFEPLERLLNRQLAESETARAEIAGLEGRVFGLELGGSALAIHMVVEAGRLELRSAVDEPADAHVSGTVSGFVRLATGDPQAAIRDGLVSFSGDVDVAQQFSRLLRALRPDWEEELSRLTGDVIAYRIGETVRRAGRFGVRFLDSLARNTADYLQEERRDLVGRHELDAFFADVDRTRDDVARLDARIARLERRLREGRPPEGSRT